MGAKTADRVPTAMRAYPRLTRFHSSIRCPRDMAEWKTATLSPYRWRKMDRVWGVRAISGTMTMTPRPNADTWSTNFKKTWVLPLPVTP